MCGIAGLVWKTKAGRRVEEFRQAAALMQHRGPDAYGEYRDERIFLIHHRLSIIDLSDGGKQPFKLSEQGAVGVYNGELYNYKTLIDQYDLMPRTDSDTEIFFRLLHRKGPAALKEFNGIFGFALYEPNRGRLLLGRDRLGVKPLYYVDCDEFFAFSSEAKSLYALMPSLKIEARVLQEFLIFGGSVGSETLVSGIRKLEPGTYLDLNFSAFSFSKKSYWSVAADVIRPGEIREDYPATVTKVRDLLASAVSRQCISDVPVGAYLSGGLDSSIVVALAAGATKGKLLTFSVNFEGSTNSELPLARMVANRYGTDHHEMEISVRGIEDELEDLILQYDEPFADPAVIPLHLMARQCSGMAKVVLQGDGGDELFAGYGRHLDLSQRKRRLAGFWILANFHPSAVTRTRMRERLRSLGAHPLSLRLAALAGAETANIELVKNYPLNRIHGGMDPFRSYRDCAEQVADLSPVQQMLYTDMQVILPNIFLEKVDKVSMWHGIEARVPLLDNDVVEYVTRLPERFKIRNGRAKMLMRDVAADWLPEEICQARKQSFGTPMSNWLRTSLYQFVVGVFKRTESSWGWLLDFDYLLSALDEHGRGIADHSSALWRATVLLIWLEKYQHKLGTGRELFSGRGS